MGLSVASIKALGSDSDSLSGLELQDQCSKMYKVKNTDVLFGPFKTKDLWALHLSKGLLIVSVGQQYELICQVKFMSNHYCM